MTAGRSVGALKRWRQELAAGTRTRLTMDRLWKAACREAMAGDFDRLGLPAVADAIRREAAQIILGTRHQRGRAA